MNFPRPAAYRCVKANHQVQYLRDYPQAPDDYATIDAMYTNAQVEELLRVQEVELMPFTPAPRVTAHAHRTRLWPKETLWKGVPNDQPI